MARDTVHLQGHSAVTTTANQATGGNIQVTAPSMVRLQNSPDHGDGEWGERRRWQCDHRSRVYSCCKGARLRPMPFRGTGGRISLTASQAFLADPSSGGHGLLDAGHQWRGEHSGAGEQCQWCRGSPAAGVCPIARAVCAIVCRCAGRLREGRVSRLCFAAAMGAARTRDLC